MPSSFCNTEKQQYSFEIDISPCKWNRNLAFIYVVREPIGMLRSLNDDDKYSMVQYVFSKIRNKQIPNYIIMY